MCLIGLDATWLKWVTKTQTLGGFRYKNIYVVNVVAIALVISYFVRGLQLRDDNSEKIKDCRCMNLPSSYDHVV